MKATQAYWAEELDAEEEAEPTEDIEPPQDWTEEHENEPKRT